MIIRAINKTPKLVDKKRLMPGVTQKMLTQQLRELESDGVVNRIVYNQVPPKVEYELTEYGWTLKGALKLLCTWGEQHIEKTYPDKDKVILNTEEVETI